MFNLKVDLKTISWIALAAVLAFMISPSSQASAFWGAVAISKASGAYGISFNQPSRTRARNVALNNCFNTGAGDCRIQTLFTGCAAIASDAGASAFGIGLASTVPQAQRKAVARCNRYAGGGCYAQVYRCNN